MKLINTGFDDNSTYFEHNLDSSGIPNIFIHGVGLDNTMWMPQKEYFHNKQIVFYDLLNHGKTKKGYKEINFHDFTKQLFGLIDYLNIKNKIVIISEKKINNYKFFSKIKKKYNLNPQDFEFMKIEKFKYLPNNKIDINYFKKKINEKYK